MEECRLGTMKAQNHCSARTCRRAALPTFRHRSTVASVAQVATPPIIMTVGGAPRCTGQHRVETCETDPMDVLGSMVQVVGMCHHFHPLLQACQTRCKSLPRRRWCCVGSRGPRSHHCGCQPSSSYATSSSATQVYHYAACQHQGHIQLLHLLVAHRPHTSPSRDHPARLSWDSDQPLSAS